MSAEQYTHIEQDTLAAPNGNELPTYDDLAAQNGPNSRFGRWRGWIEKRAAERQAEITPEIRAQRRARGWGNDEEYRVIPPTNTVDQSLHIQTSNLNIQDTPPRSMEDPSLSAPLPFVSQVIPPTHLKINHFGSRFLPHTTSQIRCTLPLLGDRMLLVGHDEGLSVLDMFPQEWTAYGDLVTKGPDEAQSRPVWKGESVYQMSILESQDHGDGTPQGVVLMVVGPAPEYAITSKETETAKTARMYNLASLISLARWTIAQKGAKPLELHKINGWQQPTSPSKRHRAHGSIAKGFKSLIDSNTSSEQPTTSYQSFGNPSMAGPSHFKSSAQSERGSPTASTFTEESSWDVVDDLPIRWATDFVPLASPGSRLAGQSVISFATWSDESRQGKGTGGQLLAIATKAGIFLYETPKGERAYRFVKEFYTPIQPRSITFFQQSVSDVRGPIPEERSPGKHHGHKRTDSGHTLKGVTIGASSSTPLSYGTHLSLFVVFDKKAGWIRLADSAVGEMELGEDGGPQAPGLLYPRDTFSSTISTSTLRQRARLSFDIRESAAKWTPPVRLDLPVFGSPDVMQPVHIFTRGKRSHVVPCPLPTRPSLTPPPLHAVFWRSAPKYVSARLLPAGNDPINDPPLLQLIAFGENGVEVQETGVSFMNTKGKGRAFPEEILRAEEDLGGEAGFLATGGNWDRLAQLTELGGIPTSSSVLSVDSMDSTDLLLRMRQEKGVYGWCRKGIADWRMFWVGGGQTDSSTVGGGGGSGLDYRDSMSSMYL